MQRTAQSVDGLLLVDKASGMTSHDVVNFIRNKFHIKKVGHCGTLDPLATGLLMMVLGTATKMQDLLMAEDKEYVGTFKLGEVTDSQDSDGVVTETKPVPEISDEQLNAAFAKYQGDFYQTPPMVSALKKDGVPLYKLARQGKTVEREPRFVHVYSHNILEWKSPYCKFVIKCSKGFYVRTYCHDIGQELGCGAHLTQLSRTRSGNFDLKNAVTWNDLQKMESMIELEPFILSLPEVSKIRRQ
jgi:tRNA pseudouridine55 synthase